MNKLLMAVVMSVFYSHSHAGIVYNAALGKSQVSMGRDESGISSCGIRVTVVAEVGDQTHWYDFSGSVYRKGMFGLWKAGSYMQPTKRLLTAPLSPEKSVRTPAPIGFWLAESSTDVPVSMSKTTPAEDKGFTLGPGDFIGTMRSILAVAKGEPAQFSMIYKNEKVERIIAFKSPLSEQDFETLVRCFSGLESGLKIDHQDILEK